MKKRTLGFAVLIWAVTAVSAGAAGLEAAVGGWRQDPSGEIGYKALGPTDLLNVENDLNYDSETRVHGRIKIDMPLILPNIYLMAAPATFDADGLKTAPFTFGGNVFAPGPFYSELTFNQYDVALYYGLPFLRTLSGKTLNIDLGVNVRIVDLQAEVRQGASSVKEDAVIPIPQLFVGVQLTPLDWLSLEAEGRGLSIGGDKIYSLIGRIRFNVAGPLFIAGGYRYDRIDVDESDVIADFTLQGPFAELGLKF